jgi:type II secretory pathway pseudopilin PulG
MWQLFTEKNQSDHDADHSADWKRQGLEQSSDCPPSFGLAWFEKRHGSSGLTLMECVVAIAIVALTGALITPPLFLAAATRVQNRRSEQALQIAQGEIDRIRTRVEQGAHSTDTLPDDVEDADFPVGAPTAIANFIRTVNTADATCNGTPIYNNSTLPANELLPVDTDGDCQADFFLQSFRTVGGGIIDGKPTDLSVGVRVYSENIATGNDQLRNALQTEQASLRFTTGEGNQRQSPLAVLYTQITWDGSGVALYCYHGTDSCN